MLAKVRAWLGNERVALFSVLLLGLALRLANLGVEPYGSDEVLSLDIVHHFPHLGEMFNYLGWVEVHPPLYYLMLHYWTTWFGFGEFAVRGLSVLFGLGVVGMVYCLARSLFPAAPKVGLWAALLVALFPMQVEYSQEARPYIIFCFFALLQAWAVWRWHVTRKVGDLALYVASGAVGLYLHYSFIYVVAALGVWWLVATFYEDVGTLSRRFTWWLVAQAALFVAFFPWLSAELYKGISLGQYIIGGAERTVVSSLRSLTFVERTLNQLVWMSQQSQVEVVTILAVVLFKVVGLWFVVSLVVVWSRRSLAAQPTGWSLSFLGTLVLVPVLLYMLSPQSLDYSLITERHVIVSSVALAVLLAFLLSQLALKRRLVLLALFVATIIPSLSVVVGDDSVWNPYFRLQDVGAYVSEYYRPGDLVLIESAGARTDINHFLRGDIESRAFFPMSYFGDDYLSSRETLGLVENDAQLRLVKFNSPQAEHRFAALVSHYHPKRVWLLYFDPEYEVAAQNWFLSHRWRQAISAPNELFPVSLYVLNQ